jgi:hypothetical protein
MHRIRPYEEALRGKKHKGFRAAVHAADLWGPLPGVWNARDGEYVAGQAKGLHCTTLQTQPWQPFPHDLHYHPHRLSDLWNGLDRDADRIGFTILTRQYPTQRIAELRALQQPPRRNGHVPGTSIDTFLRTLPVADPQRLADLARTTNANRVHRHDACADPIAGPDDGVVSIDQLQRLEADDVPWRLDERFRQARGFAYAVVPCYAARETLSNGENAHVTRQPSHWWREQLAAASRRHPGPRWVLVTQPSRRGRCTEHTGSGDTENLSRE